MFILSPETITWPVWVLMGIFCIAFAIQLFYYLYFFVSVWVVSNKEKKRKVTNKNLPPISVIICAKNESQNLSNFLPSILNQQYPNYEVIVVNDGSTDESEEVLLDFKKEYPHLYHTYVPQNTKIMSPKKLALTVGIKAAKHDYLLFTDADCQPVSENWILHMTEKFTANTDFVLGYGAYEQKKGLLSHLISYDSFFIALQYLGFAYKGKPYMGVGRNMAYRKQLFFDMRGFASILHLQSGDDDLFVNKAANKYNTQIVVNPESITVSGTKECFKDWFLQKERHLSTAAYYKNESKYLIGVEVLSRGLFYVSLIALSIYAPLLIVLATALLFLLRYGMQCIIINVSAKKLNERRFYLSILFFDMLLPLISLLILTTNKLSKKSKYQWK